jgi:hypothetical protein
MSLIKCSFPWRNKQKLSGLAVVKTNFDAIQIRQPFACFIHLKISGILFQHHRLSFFPGHKLERAGADSMTPEVGTIFSTASFGTMEQYCIDKMPRIGIIRPAFLIEKSYRQSP